MLLSTSGKANKFIAKFMLVRTAYVIFFTFVTRKCTESIN